MAGAGPGGRHGLVLQGGGALGAFELGAARAIYASAFRPDVISGVSIGAISAALLGRPKGGDPVKALETFWREVAVSSPFVPTPLAPLLSNFGVPGFYSLALPLTPYSASVYDTAPLRRTLSELIDVDALADPAAQPELILTATDIAAGELVPFRSFDRSGPPLTIDHILASGSLPPSFPATTIDGVAYWDGGVFDNTPLGAVIDRLTAEESAVLVVDLFPRRNTPPATIQDVGPVFANILFANKTASDLSLLRRFNQVARLFAAAEPHLEAAAGADPELAAAYEAIRSYRYLAKVVEVNRTRAEDPSGWSDFSVEGIRARAAEGQASAEAALRSHGFL
jgi:NTE family protein